MSDETERLSKEEMNEIATLIRVVQGKPVDPDSIITQLTNVKELLERTRFPTYPILAKQVYLRLIAKYNVNASSCKEWADQEAKALISYKGQSRSESVEMNKSPQLQPTQQFSIGEHRSEAQPEKRHFWQRSPKKEESEFNE